MVELIYYADDRTSVDPAEESLNPDAHIDYSCIGAIPTPGKQVWYITSPDDPERNHERIEDLNPQELRAELERRTGKSVTITIA